MDVFERLSEQLSESCWGDRSFFFAEANGIEMFGWSQRGVEEAERFGFNPSGSKQMSLALLIPGDRKPPGFPKSGISVYDEKKQNLIGPANSWRVVNERQVAGHYLVKLMT